MMALQTLVVAVMVHAVWGDGIWQNRDALTYDGCPHRQSFLPVSFTASSDLEWLVGPRLRRRAAQLSGSEKRTHHVVQGQ